METITGIVIATRHAGTSTMGNPSYWVTIQDEDGNADIFRTQSNSGLAYGIENKDYRTTPHTFHLSRAGRITWAEVAR